MSDTRNVEHDITVAAAADDVYRLIADVTKWPQLFPPTVYVDHVERNAADERIRIWATAQDSAKTWTSRRVLDDAARRIEFRQEVSQPPVGAMGGTWIVETLSDKECRVRLLHDYRAVDDDPEKLAWIDGAVDTNSTRELAALKRNAELATGAEELVFSFTDSVRIAGSAKDAYDFINEAQHWQERLPHVARVSLVEETPGLQLLEMDTRTKDDSTHTTRSVRVCFPHHRIVYKQVVVPALMTLHTGIWTFTEIDDGVEASSQHTVALNPENFGTVLGEGAGTEQAREFVRNALGTNSLATLGYAKDYAEQRQG